MPYYTALHSYCSEEAVLLPFPRAQLLAPRGPNAGDTNIGAKVPDTVTMRSYCPFTCSFFLVSKIPFTTVTANLQQLIYLGRARLCISSRINVFACSFTFISSQTKSLEYEKLNVETFRVISFGRFSFCALTWNMTTTPAGIRSNNTSQRFVLEQKAILIPETRKLSAISCKKLYWERGNLAALSNWG